MNVQKANTNISTLSYTLGASMTHPSVQCLNHVAVLAMAFYPSSYPELIYSVYSKISLLALILHADLILQIFVAFLYISQEYFKYFLTMTFRNLSKNCTAQCTEHASAILALWRDARYIVETFF